MVKDVKITIPKAAIASAIFAPNKELVDIEFSKEDIETTIDEIDRDAATTENDIPASVLKECKNTLSYPIYLIWKKSFDTETIPSDMKIQSINPIFKKVTNLIPRIMAQYL